MAILTACGSSADNSQKQETIVKQPEATSMRRFFLEIIY
mgnify:FL=1